jgi:hypothetical protein
MYLWSAELSLLSVPPHKHGHFPPSGGLLPLCSREALALLLSIPLLDMGVSLPVALFCPCVVVGRLPPSSPPHS